MAGRRAALLLLFRIVTEASVPVLGQLVSNSAVSELVCQGLEPLPYPQVDLILAAAVDGLDGARRRRVIDALATRRSAAAVPVLLGLLAADTDHETVASICRALERIGPVEGQTERTAASILPWLTSDDAAVRETAAEAVVALGPDAAAVGVLQHIAGLAPETPTDALVEACAGLLAGTVPATAAAALGETYRDATTSGRVAIIRVLGHLGGEDALTMLAEVVDAGQAEMTVAMAAAAELAAWPTPDPAPVLLDAFRGNTKGAVREAVLEAYLQTIILMPSGENGRQEEAYEAALAAARDERERDIVRRAREELRVTHVVLATGKRCQVVPNGLQAGAPVYVDRPYTFVRIPPDLVGRTFLRLVMDDKYATGADYLTFRVSKPVSVYVGYDHRADGTPAWLRSWEAVGTDIRSTDAGCHLQLYRRRYPTGIIKLGGNRAPGAGAHYIVVLVD